MSDIEPLSDDELPSYYGRDYVHAAFRPYGDPDKPGRKDVGGVEWWACGPYPTWFRWENGELFTCPARWPDGGLLEIERAKAEIERLEAALRKARRRLEIVEAAMQEEPVG